MLSIHKENAPSAMRAGDLNGIFQGGSSEAPLWDINQAPQINGSGGDGRKLVESARGSRQSQLSGTAIVASVACV